MILIGCSGWAYKDWTNDFYPAGTKAEERLAYYQARFPTVEINASFYRLPTEAAVRNWAEKAPEGFVFAWKASRFITHNKKLKDCADSIDLVFGRMAPLGRDGPVLFQLPPNLHADLPRLEAFADLLPGGYRCTFEFRHPSWYADDVLAALERRGIALCISDHHHAPSPWIATAPFVYIRGHGPGGRYFGRYPTSELEAWAGKIAAWLAGGRQVFCYFDNDIKGAAPRDAAALTARLKG